MYYAISFTRVDDVTSRVDDVTIAGRAVGHAPRNARLSLAASQMLFA